MDMKMPQSLFFMDLPDLGSLCSVKIIINAGISNSSIREIQIKLCRHLLFLYNHIVASPVPEQLNQILVVTPISFYKTGKIQSVVEKHGAKIYMSDHFKQSEIEEKSGRRTISQMESPEIVTPARLQACLSYTIATRLAPHWNKAGHLLIQGEDFLAKTGKQDAVAMHINVSATQICISVQVHTIRLPPCELFDFNIATGPLQSFLNRKNSVILRHCISSNWCYILPSMKMGQIINISHDIPPESPFKSYKDFQNHWNMLYGYELPKVSENDVIYCSVYFKLIGEKLFTYPFICVRSQPMQFYPGVDLTRVLSEFVSDLKSSMSHLFGVLMSMTNKPVYPTNELTTLQSQVDNQNLVNLTTELHFRSIYQDSNHLRNSTETSQKMVCEREKSWELALGNLHSTNHLPSLSIEPMTSFPPPLGSQSSYPSLLHIGKIQRYVPVFQKKVVKVGQNNLTLAAGSTNVVIPHTLKKYNTPDFKLKHIMPVNSTKFQVKNTRASFSQILKAKGKTETSNLVNKLTNMKNNRETFTNSINTTLEPCSSVVARKHFATALCQVHGKSLSQPSQFKKNDNELNCTKYIPACISNKRETHTNDPECGTKSSTSIAACSVLEGSIQGKYLEFNTKVCRTHQTIKEVDVESHARNNQLFKLRNATLQNWLKKHGISTKARDKKEQLVTKIMQFIHES